MAQQAKEGAQAFMPTSNDSLAVNGSHHSSQSVSPRRQSARSPNFLPNESAVLSPPARYHSSDGLVSPTDMSELPSRQHVSSASQLPSFSAMPLAAASESHPPFDQTFWNSQYQKAIEIHENERKLWNDEKQFLERHISWLKDELYKKRSDSGVSYFGSGAKENDKVFPDAEVIRQSQEKLRSFSNVSPLKEHTSANGIPVTRTVRDVPTDDDYIGHRQSAGPTTYPPTSNAGKRLSSITENVTSAPEPRRVSINETSTTIAEAHVAEILNDEVPMSPPTTAQAATPPNAKVHAGSTPPIPRMPIGEEDDDAAGDGEASLASFGRAAPMYVGMDHDPELDSPKMLPSEPHHGNIPELSDLNRRLESVAADPEGNLPEVVRSASTSPAPPPNATGNDNEVGGVKLKTRRSMNFGAPLGNLRMD